MGKCQPQRRDMGAKAVIGAAFILPVVEVFRLDTRVHMAAPEMPGPAVMGRKDHLGQIVRHHVAAQHVTVVNERDMLGSDMVPDYLTEVVFASHYGWPWHFWRGHVDPRVEPKNLDHRQYERRPDYSLGAHVAPLGLAFSHGQALGAPFDSGAIIARHGSWNRKPLSGYDVVYVDFNENGKPQGKPQPVLSGFVDDEENARGRPTMVTFDQTGALLVSDDISGIIWRVSKPGAAKSGTDEAAKAE